jgi:signal transduction histidine kinase
MFESAEKLLSWSEFHGLESTLILMDWVMPELQGPELCRMIRADSPGANTYIIMASAKSDSADIAEGLGAGADDYISKPFVRQEVSARLEVGMRTVELRAELKETERKRLIAERFAGVGQLAAGAAHEINNPLGFLKSNLSLLQSDLPRLLDLMRRFMDPSESVEATRSALASSELNEIIEDYADMMLDMRLGVDRICAIVDSLRAFTAELPLTRPDIDLVGLIKELTGDNVTLDLQSKGSVIGDRVQLKQSIQALLDNAAWATREGGDVALSLSEAREKVRLVISDTGCGIEPSNLCRIADPFFTTRPVGEALGMGLSRAQAVIRGHGGDIQISSRLGSGTRVIVELPSR